MVQGKSAAIDFIDDGYIPTVLSKTRNYVMLGHHDKHIILKRDNYRRINLENIRIVKKSELKKSKRQSVPFCRPNRYVLQHRNGKVFNWQINKNKLPLREQLKMIAQTYKQLKKYGFRNNEFNEGKKEIPFK